jgi:hypothetical protein
MKQPTIKQVLDSINRLPGVHAVYSSTFKEFAVKVVNCPDATYFTEDRADALMTAVAMSYKTQGGE